MDDRAEVDARFGVRWQAVFSGWAVAFLAGLAIGPLLLSLYGLLAGPPVERGELRHKRGEQVFGTSAPASVTFPLWAWLVFVGLVAALLFLDLFVLHRGAREMPFGEALWLSGFWIALSLAFGGFVWFVGGADPAVRYLTAYLVEKSLSVDNVFVFAVIFSRLAVPERHRYHVLFYGVIGALLFRLIFILAGADGATTRIALPRNNGSVRVDVPQLHANTATIGGAWSVMGSVNVDKNLEKPGCLNGLAFTVSGIAQRGALPK